MASRKQYLRNKLTGNVFEVASTTRAREYFGSSNRTADGSPIYERVNRAVWMDYRSKLHPDNPQHVRVRGKKNPAPKFGKRRATHKAFKKAAPPKKFGKRRARHGDTVRVSGVKNPLVAYYGIRGKDRDGKAFYFTGLAFDSDRKKAAHYTNPKQAEKVLDAIEDRAPKQLGALDVYHFFKDEKRPH